MSDPTVLVVDDLPQNVRLLDAVLSPRGFRVVGVGSGEGALSMMREEPPDIVLLDILMPGMDGWGVLEALKADPATASAPVVVVTILDERAQALALGAAEFLVKPVGREDVIGALSRVGALPAGVVNQHHSRTEAP